MKRTRVACRAGLAVVLIAIACTESVGPERRNPGVPLFSYSANGITLDQQNGTLGDTGRLLVKGFNPTNPHHGDAIIATFYWVGSNTIDSVRDVLTTAPTYTPVGNTYHLVELVQAGGYSMATYVATNVQNFPDPNTDPNQGDIYAVAGYFSQKITDGGVSVSAWTGVEDNFAAALGEHRSASGSGPGGFEPVPAQAGPIAVNAGAVAHTATMSGVFLLDGNGPQGYTTIGVGSDNFIKQGTAYAVQASAGTTNPTWTWFWPSPDTWLVTTFALNRAPAPGANQPPTANFTSSCSALNCNFTSTSSDPDGTIASYSWNFGDGFTSTAQNPSHSYGATGSYNVTLQVTDNQGAQSPITTKSVNVTAANQAPTANFTSRCNALNCNFTSTSSDPDGTIASYSWTFGDGFTSTAQNPSHNYTAAGSYPVTLQVTDDQGAPSPITTKTVNVTAPNSAPVVNAGADEPVLLGLLYSTSFSFSDPDNGPWNYTIDWGDGSTSTGSRPSAGSFSASHTYSGLILLGKRTIRVTVTDSLGASGSDTKNVTIVLSL